jgi:hypothetical protein
MLVVLRKAKSIRENLLTGDMWRRSKKIWKIILIYKVPWNAKALLIC